jgi:hypothetical protein
MSWSATSGCRFRSAPAWPAVPYLVDLELLLEPVLASAALHRAQPAASHGLSCRWLSPTLCFNLGVRLHSRCIAGLSTASDAAMG